MAANTWLRDTLPLEHADPALTEMPAKSIAITNVSAFNPLKAKQLVLAKRDAPLP
jgi:hypothetical protein